MFTRFMQMASYQNANIILNEDPQSGKGALWLGDFTAALDKKGLRDRNITTVLTTAAGLNVSYPGNQITHHQYYILDIESFNISKHFEETGRAIEEGLKRGNVLVHCAAGISRSSSCVIAYLMRYRQMSYTQAFSLVRQKRKCVFPNYGFQRQLKQYEVQLRSRRTLDKSETDQQFYQTQMNSTAKSKFSVGSPVKPTTAGKLLYSDAKMLNQMYLDPKDQQQPAIQPLQSAAYSASQNSQQAQQQYQQQNTPQIQQQSQGGAGVMNIAGAQSMLSVTPLSRSQGRRKEETSFNQYFQAQQRVAEAPAQQSNAAVAAAAGGTPLRQPNIVTYNANSRSSSKNDTRSGSLNRQNQIANGIRNHPLYSSTTYGYSYGRRYY